MTLERVGIIGLGEIGRILAEDLLEQQDLLLRVWDYQFDNPGSTAACNLQAIESSPMLWAANDAARTVQEAGYEPWMSEGSVKRQTWAPQFNAALDEESLAGMLDAIRAQIHG